MQLKKYDINEPKDIELLGTALQEYVKNNNLTVTIQKKPYVMVEGWQFCGNALGLKAIVADKVDYCDSMDLKEYELPTYTWKSGRKTETGIKTIKVPLFKYEIKVDLKRFGNDELVQSAYAICSNEEHGKHEFSQNAILSMAQTRATGKAYRLMIGWIMKQSGFESTPAEEMDTVQAQESEERATGVVFDKTVQSKIDKFKTVDKLMGWATDQTQLHENNDFRKAIEAKQKQLENV